MKLLFSTKQTICLSVVKLLTCFSGTAKVPRCRAKTKHLTEHKTFKRTLEVHDNNDC